MCYTMERHKNSPLVGKHNPSGSKFAGATHDPRMLKRDSKYLKCPKTTLPCKNLTNTPLYINIYIITDVIWLLLMQSFAIFVLADFNFYFDFLESVKLCKQKRMSFLAWMTLWSGQLTVAKLAFIILWYIFLWPARWKIKHAVSIHSHNCSYNFFADFVGKLSRNCQL